MSAQEMVDDFSNQFFRKDCCSIVIASSFFETETFFRIRTTDDEFEEDDVNTLITATERVLEILKSHLKENKNETRR